MTAMLFIFDLDNTLYPKGLPIWRMVDGRIRQYVIEKLRIDRDTARRIRMEFLARFGSTLRGLMHHHGVRPAGRAPPLPRPRKSIRLNRNTGMANRK